MAIFDSIGDRLRREREELGLSQSDIASAIASAGASGTTRQSQSLYEKGKRVPDSAYLAVIASLGIDVGFVLTGAKTPKAVLDNMRLAAQITIDADMSAEEKAALMERFQDMARAAPSVIANRVAEATTYEYSPVRRLRSDQIDLLDAYERCAPDARQAAIKLLASAAQSQCDTRTAKRSTPKPPHDAG